MDYEEIHRLIDSLSLATNDDPSVSITADEISQGTKECEGSIVGQFVTTKSINIKLLRPALLKSWKVPNFQVLKLRHNVFQFFFCNP